jgi:hypothetical protein
LLVKPPKGSSRKDSGNLSILFRRRSPLSWSCIFCKRKKTRVLTSFIHGWILYLYRLYIHSAFVCEKTTILRVLFCMDVKLDLSS